MNALFKSTAIVAAATTLPTLAEAVPIKTEPPAPSIAPAITVSALKPTPIGKLWAERSGIIEQERAATRVMHRIEREAQRRAGPPDPAITFNAKNDRFGLSYEGRKPMKPGRFIERWQIQSELGKLEPTYDQVKSLRGRPFNLSKRQAARQQRLKELLKLSERYEERLRGFKTALGYDEATKKDEALLAEQNEIESRILKMRSVNIGDLQIKFALVEDWDDSCNHFGADSIVRDMRRMMRQPATLTKALEEAA